MDLALSGKHILVTGASRGIGLATVRAFLAEGAQVSAVARSASPELLETSARFIAADLSTAEGANHAVEEVLGKDDRLDALVNNAGGGQLTAEVLADPLGGSDDVWEETLALNLYAAVRTTRAALPALSRARGSIVNIASHSAVAPHTAPAAYSAAKAALNAFSRGLAERFPETGVRVNVVTPSATQTALMLGENGMLATAATVMGVDPAVVRDGFAASNGMVTGAMVHPDEIAKAIVLLTSPTLPSAVGSNWAIHAGAIKTPA